MQKVFEKIIEKLEEKSIFMTTCDGFGANCVSVGTIEEIVKQEAEKLGNDTNVGSNRMKNFNGTCYGTCYKCICQECEGNCAMNCLIDSKPEKIAQMTNDEEYVVCCSEFKQIDVSEKKYPCSKCDSVTNDLFEPKKQTNADRIRSMSDEELAGSRVDRIDFYTESDIPEYIGDFDGIVNGIEEAIALEIKWLQSEVEE